MNFPIVKVAKGNKDYPRVLSEIHDSPEVLYCRGNLKLLNTSCFAVVGTRKLTAYGKESARLLSSDLARNGFTIVSGLALGIDAVAHQSALDAGGKTIAVLGSGVDDENIYPKTNFQLGMDVLRKEGLIVSEYPAGFHANEKTFPQRNRIISGLSVGVLIIEADKESGSLITARCALDQNRDVFAVPGSIFSSKSIGPNGLIQQGAKLVSSAEDIINEYGQNLNLSDSKKINISTKNPVQKQILDILDSKGALHADEIIRESKFEPKEIITALSMLEIEGYVKNYIDGKQ